jgi:hypothetical protein
VYERENKRERTREREKKIERVYFEILQRMREEYTILIQ